MNQKRLAVALAFALEFSSCFLYYYFQVPALVYKQLDVKIQLMSPRCWMEHYTFHGAASLRFGPGHAHDEPVSQ